ncbi:alpha/beta-hydrolase [Piromyces finnis]|uniref:Alpha/beta-hydrolase n=1 Tax=Piromyces finnis TaxID=1754191 RepID=A0A1Y1V0A9_9FUNG|nr:alpha/beta-hydrolase [Piromyces finnis]|eukprot:ORX43252.1 alpha/beta-hydrolase [Piromyces finnis]
MKHLIFLTILLMTFIFSIHTKVISTRAEELKPDYTVEKNISYVENDGEEEQKLDIYYDKNDLVEGKPVVIYIHGGYWCEGDKKEDEAIGERIQKEGYVAVLSNYRLYPKVNSIDDMILDIYFVIQWTINNIERYGGDPRAMTLVGFNAGAYLASMTLLRKTLEMKVKDTQLVIPVTFKNLILLNSPYSFEKDERLSFEINNMKAISKYSPELKYLEKYAEAKEALILGNNNVDEVNMLKEQEDDSILSLGTEKITFIECDNDTNYPIGSSHEIMQEVKRVVYDVELVKKVYHGNYDYIINGIKNKDEGITASFISLIQSSYVDVNSINI